VSNVCDEVHEKFVIYRFIDYQAEMLKSRQQTGLKAKILISVLRAWSQSGSRGIETKIYMSSSRG